MASRRQRKVAELLHEELSQVIQFQSQDPRLSLVTVTGVDISPDLRNARVYVTVLGDENETKEALKGLTRAAGYFRRKLAETVSLRYIPDLAFKLDTSLLEGLRVDSILDSLHEETSTNGDRAGADEAGPAEEGDDREP